MADLPYVIKCHCKARDHNVAFDYFDSWHEELIVGATLNHYLPFWKRIWVAVKYVLGVDNTHAHYTETIMCEDQVKDLHQYLTNVLDEMATNKSISEEVPKQGE